MQNVLPTTEPGITETAAVTEKETIALESSTEANVRSRRTSASSNSSKNSSKNRKRTKNKTKNKKGTTATTTGSNNKNKVIKKNLYRLAFQIKLSLSKFKSKLETYQTEFRESNAIVFSRPRPRAADRKREPLCTDWRPCRERATCR